MILGTQEMALLVSIFTTTTTTTPMPKMSLVVKQDLMAYIKDEPSAGRLNQELLPQDQSVKRKNLAPERQKTRTLWKAKWCTK